MAVAPSLPIAKAPLAWRSPICPRAVSSLPALPGPKGEDHSCSKGRLACVSRLGGNAVWAEPRVVRATDPPAAGSV